MVYPVNRDSWGQLGTTFTVPISTWHLAAGKYRHPLDIHKVKGSMLVFHELSQSYSFKMVSSPVINNISMARGTSAQIHSSVFKGCKFPSIWIGEMPDIF